ncbi:hypothetical protein [Derxia gummosa]|uniref:Uncharacterized protein n=1 Tax=Derxia gummosa DSM 723 TaxID=1121388 RepID=A0A8B6XBX3_9BURK|nr:hypothetical protein [Derxia gummosa]
MIAQVSGVEQRDHGRCVGGFGDDEYQPVRPGAQQAHERDLERHAAAAAGAAGDGVELGRGMAEGFGEIGWRGERAVEQEYPALAGRARLPVGEQRAVLGPRVDRDWRQDLLPPSAAYLYSPARLSS